MRKSITWMMGIVVLGLSGLAHAQVTGLSGYDVEIHYTPTLPAGDSLSAFDLGANGDIYFTYGNFNWPNQTMGADVYNGTTQTNLYTSAAAGDDFPGSGTVHDSTAGEYFYFLRDNATPGFSRVETGTTTVSNQTSVSPVSSFTGHNNRMFVSGGSGLYYGDINTTDGSVASLTEISDGPLTASSGPIAFDDDGNMFFAPGFNDQRVYKFTATEVADAIADPINDGLIVQDNAPSEWYDYSTDPILSALGGITGLTFDGDGDLLATVTSFTNPSRLVELDVDTLGDYAGTLHLASSIGRLGSVRYDAANDAILFNDGTQVYELVPEPTTLAMLIGGSAYLMRRRNRSRQN